MAKNPFKQNKDFEQSPKRNSFDLSHTVNATFDFGNLYPVFCQETLPGDKFIIDPYMALRFLPLVFPVQTRMRAHLHFFYVRNRNLWKGFPDFIAGNTPATKPSSPDGNCPPFITDKSHPDLFRTGSLGDYLGIPTTLPPVLKDTSVTLLDEVRPTKTYPCPKALCCLYRSTSRTSVFDDTAHTITGNLGFYPGVPITSKIAYVKSSQDYLALADGTYYLSYYNCYAKAGDPASTAYKANSLRKMSVPILASNPSSSTPVKDVFVYLSGLVVPSHDIHHRYCFEVNASKIKIDPAKCFILTGNSASVDGSDPSFYEKRTPRYHKRVVGKDTIYTFYYDDYATSSAPSSVAVLVAAVKGVVPAIDDTTVNSYAYLLSNNIDYLDNGLSVFNEDNGLSINSLPFRAYESIYNSFYRDSRNNPFLINGKPSYNEYLPSTDGGLDTTLYRIHRRNWELDMFTSCVQSPQQGVAPLVGISSLGEVTFASEDGRSYTFASETASDGDTITGINVTENIPNSVARSVLNVVQQGISINDFRNVNAFQRWKETNLRRGLKFKDQIKARWGVDIHYNVLDMPEFIGGVSTDVDVNTVTQSSETEQSPLGAYAGQATAFGSSNNKITQYSDEHGFIIGILSIVPVPVYSQTLPRYFGRFNPLDYYNPEFGQIGMQPVTNRDLSPINAVAVGSDPHAVFGYNRPWPEYMMVNDSAHGDFRTTLKDFLLMREFTSVPVLGTDFTTINHTELNNVFATDEGNKALGCIHFDVTAIRPIPSISVPSLE